MEYCIKICRLSHEFYDLHSKDKCPEILEKNERAYNCVSFVLPDGKVICIPYRTEINHQYAYHFRMSERSVKHKSGLDYTKIVIVEEPMIDSRSAVIDSDEYTETIKNINRIVDGALDYINEYKLYVLGKSTLNKKECDRRYRYTTLRYFHPEIFGD